MGEAYCTNCGLVGNPAVPCASCDGEEFAPLGLLGKTLVGKVRKKIESPCFDCYFRGNGCAGPKRDGTPREDCQL